MILDILKKNKTLQELLVGIVLFSLAGEAVILIFEKRIYNTAGFFAGIIVSLFCAVHMAWSVDVMVSLEEKTAISYMRKYTMLRYFIMCVVLAVIGYTDVASPVTLVVGYMGLKIGAYINPFVHKFMNKSIGGGEEQ